MIELKIIGIIPARFGSSRFTGKPLADICGKPMVLHVYDNLKKSDKFSEVLVATDDERIAKICKENNVNFLMTGIDVNTPTERIWEVSEIIDADCYVSINGDEPLVDTKTIESVLPIQINQSEIFVSNIITEINDPVEVVDPTNLKVVCNKDGNGVYISRCPIPYPKGSMDYTYFKHVGIYAFNKCALDFYHNTERGKIEMIEDIDLLRFIENGKNIKFIKSKCSTLSVDTPKDLAKVIKIMESREK